MPSHVLVCDMDNTLLPCSEFYQQARDQLFALIAQQWPTLPSSEVEAILRLTLELAARRHGGPASRALRDQAWAIGAAVFDQPYTLYPGVREALVETRAQGHRLVLATKGDPTIQWEKKIQPNGLDELFDHIEVCLRKPPETLARAYAIGDQGQGRPGRMIGDSLTDDIAGGQQAGLHTIWIRPTHEAVALDPFRVDVTPDHALERFADLRHAPPAQLPWSARPVAQPEDGARPARRSARGR